VHNELVAGDCVVQEFTFTPASSSTRGLYFDQVQVMTQLGLMSEPAAQPA
jgi:hypothetical protein